MVCDRTGDVILPVDLLEYDPALRKVLLRAFNVLIARTDEVAATLASKFRLSSVTVSGRVSRPGSLQGGWNGNRVSAGQHIMGRKLDTDMLQVIASPSSACRSPACKKDIMQYRSDCVYCESMLW